MIHSFWPVFGFIALIVCITAMLVLKDFRRAFLVPEGYVGLLYRQGSFAEVIGVGRHIRWGRHFTLGVQDLRKTSEEANKALTHIDEVLGENRADVRQAVVELRKSLTTLTDITGRVDQTLDVNTENIDELLDNFRRVSQNLKEFTDTIKKRPYTLIRATNPREHKPGSQQ